MTTIVKRLIRVRREQIVKECAGLLPIMLFADVSSGGEQEGSSGITRPTCELHLMETLFSESIDPISIVERLCPLSDRACDFSPAL